MGKSRNTTCVPNMGVTVLSSGPVVTPDPPWQAPPAPTTWDYYIDPAGSNANAGTSPGAAWADFTNLAGAGAIAAGKRIGLKRGSVFRASLVMGSSGAAGNPIIVGAYGTGDRPRVTGGALKTGWALQATDGAGLKVYSVTASDPHVITMGGVALVRNATAAGASDLAPGQWAYISGAIWVKQILVGTLLDIEVPARSDVISFDNISNVTFRDINVDLATDRTIRGQNTVNITLLSMNVSNSTKFGSPNGIVGFIAGSGAKCLGLTMRNLITTLAIYSGGHYGMEIGYCDIQVDPGPGVHENIIHLDGSTPPSEAYNIHHNYLSMGLSDTSKPVINAGQYSDGVLHTGGGYIGYNTIIGGNVGISVNNSGTLANPIVIEKNTIRDYGKVLGNTWPGGLYCPMNYDQQYITVQDNVFSNGVSGIWMQDSSNPDGSVVQPGNHNRAHFVFRRNVIQNMTQYSFWCGAKISGEFTNNVVKSCAIPITASLVIAGDTWKVSGNTIS